MSSYRSEFFSTLGFIVITVSLFWVVKGIEKLKVDKVYRIKLKDIFKSFSYEESPGILFICEGCAVLLFGFFILYFSLLPGLYV